MTLEGMLHEVPLHRFAGLSQGLWLVGQRVGQLEVRCGNAASFRHDYGTLHAILELAHVPRPRMELKRLLRVRCECRDALTVLSTVAPKEFLRDQTDVVPAFAKRRDLH